jgi:hypothetical protein
VIGQPRDLTAARVRRRRAPSAASGSRTHQGPPRAALRARLVPERLRQKIEPNPKHPQYVLTQHGLGYKFAG